MAKFKLATDKTIIVSGVLTTIKAGEHETKDKDIIEKLRNAINVEEVKSRSNKPQD